MKSVGLLTIYIANYGAVLQTYALQRYIRNNFSDVEVSVVDFYSNRPYNIFNKVSPNPFKNLVKQAVRLFHYNSLKRRYHRERRFIEEEFCLSKRYEAMDELMMNIPAYDVYLTGSDQVFNIDSPYRNLFFQQFSIRSGIKAAYAPSFGNSDFTEDFKRIIKPLVQDFDYISCREDDGAKMLEELLGRTVPTVLDPTLLLKTEEWELMMTMESNSVDFLLVYDLNGGQTMINIAVEIASTHNWKVWCITSHAEVKYKGVDRLIFDAGPREFVGLFYKAKYVVTDSFHGTVFSLIFSKPFKSYIAVSRSSRRIISLLNSCDKIDHIVSARDSHVINTYSTRRRLSFSEIKRVSELYIRDIITNA